MGQKFAVDTHEGAVLHSPAMKPFQIFRPGRHTAANGQTIEFSQEMLRAAVASYDPAKHEAPIVVGHPRANGPAYGWIKSLAFDEAGAIVAETQQVEAEFSEMVQAGRFKKRSASWYLPDAPNNPAPGSLYLRHVGFLGAQPPAIKGLKEVEFGEAEEGVIEFSDSERWAFSTLGDLLRNLREWFIAEKGTETADKLIPGYAIDNVAAAAIEKEDDSPAMPEFNERNDHMTIEELKAQVAALTAERDALKTAQAADFSEKETALAARETALAAREAAADRLAVQSRIDAAMKAGRLLPAQAKQIANFAMGLSNAEATIDFGEGDKAEKVTQREAYLRQIEAAPVLVDYSERAPAAGGAPGSEGDTDPTAIADKARDLVKARASEGKTISFTEAVAEVMTATDAGA